MPGCAGQLGARGEHSATAAGRQPGGWPRGCARSRAWHSPGACASSCRPAPLQVYHVGKFKQGLELQGREATVVKPDVRPQLFGGGAGAALAFVLLGLETLFPWSACRMERCSCRGTGGRSQRCAAGSGPLAWSAGTLAARPACLQPAKPSHAAWLPAHVVMPLFAHNGRCATTSTTTASSMSCQRTFRCRQARWAAGSAGPAWGGVPRRALARPAPVPEQGWAGQHAAGTRSVPPVETAAGAGARPSSTLRATQLDAVSCPHQAPPPAPTWPSWPYGCRCSFLWRGRMARQ